MARQKISSEELYTQVRQLVAEEYGVDVEVVKPDTNFDDYLEGKCIDVWEFIPAIGEIYKLEIPIVEVSTVEELVEYIRTH